MRIPINFTLKFPFKEINKKNENEYFRNGYDGDNDSICWMNERWKYV